MDIAHTAHDDTLTIENKIQFILLFFFPQNYSTATAADSEITNKTPLQKKFQVKLTTIFDDIENQLMYCFCFCLLACNSESTIWWTTCSFNVTRWWNWTRINVACT